MKPRPRDTQSKPLGPPNYHGPTGQINAETLALIEKLQQIREAIQANDPTRPAARGEGQGEGR
jgi:hypothetical protein